ncbi:YihY family inner membrane protein [Luteibacter aegosomaticola]|uniref:YihY family inner membrane protein n=1 Tax=Luteibacter aegosomaticola TaxID=2911538 RepID=UPI001FFB2496|nr:YihY family inner membrane protein [Luteibacter aegosomaticola]UPG91397.1 YihY family inner membrane protein [Luteibacter aegosomaticola]
MPLRFDRDRALSFTRFTWLRFVDDKCFETAGALSYTTLVSLVPLTVAVFAILSAFPVFAEWRGSLANYAFQNFVPATGMKIQEYMLAFADKASQLTGISILVMLFSAVSMMVSIEDRLNRIWRVRKPRGWGSRLLLYWAALTLGPILVVGGLVASSYLTALPMLHAAADQIATQGGLLNLLPFVITFITLVLMYTMVPNRRVSWRHAAIGALLGAVLFEIARWGFTEFIRHAPTYEEIYGALAAIPIFLLWIYLSWIIVILGASIAASISAFEYMRPHDVLPEGAEFIGLLVVLQHFVDAQRTGENVDPATVRLSAPYLPSHAIACYFEDLQKADMIQRCESGGWMLSRSLDATELLRVYRCTHYRLPLHPREQVERLGIRLPASLLVLLDQLAVALDATLGARLDQLFPPPNVPNEDAA